MSGHGVRRLCVAVDLERYSRRDNPGQQAAQAGMVRVLREAGERAALERAHWATQQQGDGELALLPPGVDEARVIALLVRELRAGLFQYNRHANASARLRMRVAIHQGITYVAENGFAGDAVNVVCRLRDAPPAKTALERYRKADLVLIVSQTIYEDVIAHDVYDLRSEEFSRVHVELQDKGFNAPAWIYVSDRTEATAGASAEAEPGSASAPTAHGPQSSRASQGDQAVGHQSEEADQIGRPALTSVTGDENVIYTGPIHSRDFVGRDRRTGGQS